MHIKICGTLRPRRGLLGQIHGDQASTQGQTLTAELGSLLIINSAFGQEILDFTNDLQDKFINQRKADKLNNLMQKLMFVWQKKV